MDWKNMGFKTEIEDLDFLEEKWQSLKKKLDQPEIKANWQKQLMFP